MPKGGKGTTNLHETPMIGYAAVTWDAGTIETKPRFCWNGKTSAATRLYTSSTGSVTGGGQILKIAGSNNPCSIGLIVTWKRSFSYAELISITTDPYQFLIPA